MVLLEYFSTAVFGLIFGSFLSALTFRLPRHVSIGQGRSFCDKCKKQISWYDNIPLLSFILLKGRCRYCHKKISIRYPLIEFLTALTFVFVFYFFTAFKGETLQGSIFYTWKEALGVGALPYFFLLFLILIAIFVIDIEKQIIPDSLIFCLFLVVAIALILTHIENFYDYFFAGFAAASFLLLLVFITKGKGMGLGDVKLAIPLGTILGLEQTGIWMFLAFLTGGYLGIILILVKKAKLREKIAFGPFLVFAFVLTLFWGNKFLINLGIF